MENDFGDGSRWDDIAGERPQPPPRPPKAPTPEEAERSRRALEKSRQEMMDICSGKSERVLATVPYDPIGLPGCASLVWFDVGWGAPPIAEQHPDLNGRLQYATHNGKQLLDLKGTALGRLWRKK